jgi:hypothetical protein
MPGHIPAITMPRRRRRRLDAFVSLKELRVSCCCSDGFEGMKLKAGGGKSIL